MQPENPDSGITLDPELDEYQVPRAFVKIADHRDPKIRAANPKSGKDFELWDAMAMDQAAMNVATIFGVAAMA